MKWIALGILASITTGCSNEPRTPQEHQAAMEAMWPRPAGLPETAFLRAGLDGGEWIDCDESSNVLTCRFYWLNGGLESEQGFRLCRMFDDASELVAARAYRSHLTLTESAIRFVPIGPATVYSAGEDGPVINEDLTAKAGREFNEGNLGRCDFPLSLDGAEYRPEEQEN